MRNLLLSTVFAIAGLNPALAANNTALIMWNTANPGGAVTVSGVGSVSFGPQNLNGITVTLTSANRFAIPNSLDEANIDIDNTDSTAQTLDVIVGANAYLGHATTFELTGAVLVNAINGVSKAELTGSYFVDATDSLNGQSLSVTGTDIKDFDSGLLTGPNSFSFNNTGLDSVNGPYGLAERLTLTLQPGASVGIQGVSMTAIPEPSTWIMLLTGFSLLGLGALYRNRSATGPRSISL